MENCWPASPSKPGGGRFSVDQMAIHNNQEVAELFMKLGSMERLHADHIREKAQGYVLPKVSPWEYQWGGAESPEALDLDEIHYLIKPYQAMKLALCHEQQMAEFYGKVVRTSKNKEVRQFAKEYEEEEKEHVRLLTEWLERCPEPAPDWDDDPDPPVEQE